MLHMQVASLIEATEESMERAERLEQQLGIPADPDSSSLQGAESRRSLLQKQKVTGAACCVQKMKHHSFGVLHEYQVPETLHVRSACCLHGF